MFGRHIEVYAAESMIRNGVHRQFSSVDQRWRNATKAVVKN